MPTDDYANSAASYKLLFSGQSRSNDSAAITANEQFDRDNLLHFVEEKFKTNKKGGVSLVNLRALFHTLIKSVSMVSDDGNLAVIGQRSGQISTTSATKFYFGNATYGFNGTDWSAYASSQTSLRAQESTTAIKVPFQITNPTIKGYIQNSTSTGSVTIQAYYTDQDDGSSSYAQNPVLIGSRVVSCAITDTNYDFTLPFVDMKIPADKLIWILVQNTGYTSSTEYLRIGVTIYGNTHSSNWTTS
tara:strand:+ start:853 stop:1587 length:735 start_codon:yes stop_codon:yes gene_type:complete